MKAFTRAAAFVALAAAQSLAFAKEHHVTTIADLRHSADLQARTHAIDLFVIPDDVDTLRTIAPSKIETFNATVKRRLTSEAERSAFFRALASAMPERGTALSEFRIKAVMLDAANRRIAELYASYSPIAMLGEEQPLVFTHRNFLDFVEKTIAAHAPSR